MAKKLPDVIGQKFERLTIIDDVPRENWKTKYREVVCHCDCGEVKNIQLVALKRSVGATSSCGCLQREIASTTCEKLGKQNKNWLITHGCSNTSLYKTWEGMMQRCNNPKNTAWEYYGGRNIKVCERWHKFENFLEDVGIKPGEEYSLDRIDNNGNYEPNNVRWATWKIQANNRRPRKKKSV